MTNVNRNRQPIRVVAEPEEAAPRSYLAEAVDWTARLRAISAEFPEEPEPQPLTSVERRLVSSTTAEALEQAAIIAEAAPNVGGLLGDVDELRDTITYLFSFMRVRDEAMALVRRVDDAIIRRKLKGVRLARGLYRVAKAYASTAAGDSLRPHVEQMQRSLKTRRRKSAAPPEEPVEPKSLAAGP